MKVSTAILCALAASLARPAAALTWTIETPHFLGGYPGNDTSLVMNGPAPQVVFSSEGQVLSATRAPDGFWTEEPVALCGYAGGFCSAARSPLGSAGIAFVDATGLTNDLRYAYKSGSVWLSEKVASIGLSPDYVSLGYDSSGTAYIAYTVSDMSGLATVFMARRTGVGTWSAETIASVGDATGPSLAIDSGQKVHVAFVDSSTGRLKLAHRNAAFSWTVEDVDGSAGAPVQAYWYPSLEYRGSIPSIAYFVDAGAGTATLTYASKPQTVWIREAVKQVSASGIQYSALALDASGTPSIAFFQSNSQTLGFARRAAGTWYSETADSGSLTGFRPSIALDSGGAPLIAYFEDAFGTVQVASTLPDTVASAKLASDGELVSLDAAVASTATGEAGDDIYVQAVDRSCGIGASFEGVGLPAVARGDSVRVSGAVSTIHGERMIVSPSLSVSGAGQPPEPLVLDVRSVGGADLYFDPGPPVAGQQGVIGGRGPSNVGLLARVYGRITQIGDGYLYLDDGSGRLDGSLTNGQPNSGVRVICDPDGFLAGGFASATGPVGCFSGPAGKPAAEIRARPGEVVELDGP